MCLVYFSHVYTVVFLPLFNFHNEILIKIEENRCIQICEFSFFDQI